MLKLIFFGLIFGVYRVGSNVNTKVIQKLFVNSRVQGMQPSVNLSALSVLNCAVACNAQTTCQGFNYLKGPSSPGCELFDQQFNQTNNQQLIADQNYDYYEIDDCNTKRLCLNGGSCVKSVSGYSCICLAQYSGTVCETEITTLALTTTSSATSTSPSCNATDKVFTARTATFTSDNYPANYVCNLNCSYTVNVAGAANISFTINNSSLEEVTECRYDKLNFYEGASENNNTLALTACGVILNTTFVLNGDQVIVRFITDSSVVKYGFNVTYVANF